MILSIFMKQGYAFLQQHFLYCCFQLVYQTVFILDQGSILFNLPYKFHFKLNVALIFKLYPISCFYQSLNGISDFIQVSLATIFYAVSIIFLPHNVLGLSYPLLVPLKNFVILIDDIFKVANYILCSLSYYIDFTLS